MELANHTALVTGGAVRIGYALAMALAQNGVHVAIHYNESAVEAEKVTAELRSQGVRAAALQADLAAPDAAHELVTAARAQLGDLDILVNSAAIFPPGGLLDTTGAAWDKVMAVNLRTPFFLAQAFVQALGERRGHIVNIADWRAVRPGVGHIAYTMSKAGLVAMTRSLAQSLGPNVQVNAIAPGMILAPPGAPPDYLEKMARQIPLKRHGSPADVAQALLYLLQSDYVTGELMFVTGGQEL
ncbi:MAG: SDR family oxidoreductase [Anaerolineae bacterium]